MKADPQIFCGDKRFVLGVLKILWVAERERRRRDEIARLLR